MDEQPIEQPTEPTPTPVETPTIPTQETQFQDVPANAIGRIYLTPKNDFDITNKKYVDTGVNSKMANPMTGEHDIIVGGVGGVPEALAAQSGTYSYELICDPTTKHIHWNFRTARYLDLADGPSTFFGKGGKALRVNSGATAVEFAGPGSHVEIASPAAVQCGGSSAWEDWDLSATLPAGTLYADIVIVTVSVDSVGARKNGSAVERKVTPAAASKEFSFNMLTEVDSGRIVEIYSDSRLNSYFYVTGYWI